MDKLLGSERLRTDITELQAHSFWISCTFVKCPEGNGSSVGSSVAESDDSKVSYAYINKIILKMKYSIVTNITLFVSKQNELDFLCLFT